MNTYHINKGIGRTVEFKGLKAQYLFIFSGGILGILICVMIMYMAGVNTYLCLILGGSSSGLLTWQTFALNVKYGEHGLMKMGAQKKHPKYIISRKSIYRYLRNNRKRTDV
ncbi:DUF4133 domain-containing protein [Chryseobacterium kwangjuense]|uniref:Conjugal transfer protein TraF n=1 Tax=Chryseobacterium kwangjuense TaxID=267125 RepID=A0A135W9M9_9FLAO|nr:DUF4133 domain-containing protein [Chryseobacterium kwangjuense]KXH81591.1 conjugal transfer protein TraF [Chryseobacterium kwangjuense]